MGWDVVGRLGDSRAVGVEKEGEVGVEDES